MFAASGLQFAVATLIGLFGGHWLDTRLGTAPWLLVLGAFGGAAAGFYNIIRTLTTAERRAKSRRDKS